MTEPLAFEAADLPDEGYERVARNVDFSIEPDGWVTIAPCGRHKFPRVAFMDTASGLVRPTTGSIRFMGEDWTRMTPDRQAECRGRIGRVFLRTEAWLSNLDVDENVTLRIRHRTGQSIEDLREEMTMLAHEIGLDGIPSGRPAMVDAETLQACQWVRALLGEPPLVLAEHPGDLLNTETRRLVTEVLERRRAKGLAVFFYAPSEDADEWHRTGTGNMRVLRYDPDTGTLSQSS